MLRAERVVLVVLDSVGIGAMPDAARYGDLGANTLGNCARAVGGLRMPNMGRLGLGNLTAVLGVPPVGTAAAAAYGTLALSARGKDTMTGHWEMVGIGIDTPFRTYPEGFPADLIAALCQETGISGVLGNRVASGTVIIQQLGDEHVRTGQPIVYTSADSVFQVAAHEAVIPVPDLYRLCQAARHLLHGEHLVGRVIARPFTGSSAAGYRRTERRKDFAITPPPMLLDSIRGAGLPVQAVGKIADIFTDHGITGSVKTRDNAHGLEVIEQLLDAGSPGLIFANLVDFDQVYGHRRDPGGYAAALEQVDQRLPALLERLGARDLLMLTADHGNDPTHHGTDHTREYVPVLAAGPRVRAGAAIGVRPTLGDLGATVAELLAVPYQGRGESFAPLLLD